MKTVQKLAAGVVGMGVIGALCGVISLVGSLTAEAKAPNCKQEMNNALVIISAHNPGTIPDGSDQWGNARWMALRAQTALDRCEAAN